MRLSARLSLCLLAGFAAFTTTGCNTVPNSWMRQSQLRNRDMYAQKQAMANQAAMTDQDRARIAQENADLRQKLDLANQRLDNLQSERSQLSSRLTAAMKSQPNPLPESANRRFQDLAKKYPGFNFDPDTGVSKFSSDVLFDSGSANIKESASPLLSEFAKIMGDGEAKHLKVLVVGHTDDKPISKEATRKAHPTNWHLSTNRANSVVVKLHQYGLPENRMGSAGYSMYQPTTPNTNDKARSQNRRVEIYVLAPDSPIAQAMESEHFDPRSAINKADEFDPRLAK